MIAITDKIMQRVKQRRRGAVFTPKDFLDLGTRAAVDKGLSRLATQGSIRRLARGLYDFPKQHALLGTLWPSLDDVAKTIARDTNSQLQVTGAQAVHALGLSQQVPAQAVYLTSGRSRNIQIGNTTLKLQHASPTALAGAGKKTGLVIQALRYLGPNRISKDKISKIIDALFNAQDKKQLQQLTRFAPDWSRPLLYKIIN